MDRYVGARYMPKFVGTYDATQAYEALSVVDNGMGTSYVSNKPVPVNTPLTDTEYWAVYGSTSGAILDLQNQINEIKDGFVIPEMYGAKGDGVTDDTAAINDAIMACPNVVFLNKTYMIDAAVSVLPQDGTHLILSEGTVLKGIAPVPDTFSRIIYVLDKSNVIIEGGKIDGGRTLSTDHAQHAHGVSIETGTDVIIRDMHITGCKGDGIYIGSHYVDEFWTTVYPSQNVVVDNCEIEYCGRNGISPVACEGLRISNCVIHGIIGENPQAGIDIEVNNDTWPVKDYILDNLRIYDCTGYELIIPRANQNGIISNCLIDGSMRVEWAEDVHIHDCKITQTFEIDSRGVSADKVIDNCKIGVLIIDQSNPYKLTLNDCTIFHDGTAGQPTVYTNSRDEDVAGNCAIIFNNCSFTDNGVDTLYSFSKEPQSISILDCIMNDCRTRYTFHGTKYVNIDGLDVSGTQCVFLIYGDVINFKNVLWHNLTANAPTYGYTIDIQNCTIFHITNNVFAGNSPETAFIKANHGENPTGTVAFNDIAQFSTEGSFDAGSSLKKIYNILSGT